MSLYLGTNLISGVATPVEGARNIGQIVQSTIPLSDAGLHLLDGSLISGSGSYADFVSYIASIYDANANYFCSEADWQTSVSTYGACDKYVYDSVNNTVRIPKRSTEHGKLIKSYFSGSNWYRIYEDGWCEQGGFDSSGNGLKTINLNKNFLDTNYEVLCSSENASNASATSWTNKTTTNFKVYKSNSNCNWQACGYIDISDYQYSPIYEYLVIATSTKTDIEVDIDEIATDLNGKADVDLTNCTKPHIVDTYENGTSWYRIYSDGWCKQGGINNNNSTNERTQALLINYKDTNYSIQVCYNSDGSLSNGAIDAYNKAVNSFKLKSWSSDSICWEAKGYIS